MLKFLLTVFPSQLAAKNRKILKIAVSCACYTKENSCTCSNLDIYRESWTVRCFAELYTFFHYITMEERQYNLNRTAHPRGMNSGGGIVWLSVQNSVPSCYNYPSNIQGLCCKRL